MENIPISPLISNAWKKIGLGINSIALISFVIFSMQNGITDHIRSYIAIGILVGMMLLVISKEKNETEYIISLRYNAYRITFNTMLIILLLLSMQELFGSKHGIPVFLATLIGLFIYLLTFYVPLLTNGFEVDSKTPKVENIKKEPVVYIWIGLSMIGIIVFVCLAGS